MRRWIVGLVIAASPATALAGVTADEVLSDRRYEFCHDERYPLTDDEAEWCSLLPDDLPRCPALVAACKGPRAKLDGDGPFASRTAEEGTRDDAEPIRRRSTPSGPSRRHDQSESDAAMPQMGMFAHVMLWGIVAIMIVVLITQLRGPVPRLRSGEDRSEAEPVPDRADVDAAEILGTDLTEVGQLIARAEQRARDGDYTGAVADGRAALLRYHAEQGRLELRATRTNGDYVVELAPHPEEQAAARTVLRAVEHIQFGASRSAPQLASEVLQAVRQIVGPAILALMVVVTSLACSTDAARSYPWATSPSGRRAVLDLMRGNDLTVEFRTQPLADLDSSTTPIILADADLEQEEWREVLQMVRNGGTAIVATRDGIPLDLDVSTATRTGHSVRVSNVFDLFDDVSIVVPGRAGMTSAFDAGFDPLLVDEHGIAYAGLSELELGTVFILADDQLLTNMSVAVPDNAEALLEILALAGPKFELIDGEIRRFKGGDGGGGSSTPFAAIDQANLTTALLHLFAFILALYLWRGIHFGRPRSSAPAHRRRYAEHIEALAGHYHRAGAKRHALRHYATWALERLQETFGRGSAGLHRLGHRIARRTGRDETEVMRTLVEAWDARDDRHDDTGTAEDLACMRELGRLTEATRGKR